MRSEPLTKLKTSKNIDYSYPMNKLLAKRVSCLHFGWLDLSVELTNNSF